MDHGTGHSPTEELRQLLAATATPEALVGLATDHVGPYCAAVRDEGRTVDEIGSRARKLPAPPHVVWESLVEPRHPTARPWLSLNDDEVEPRVLAATKPERVTWSTLWPSRPNDEVHFEVTASGSQTLFRFTLLTPGAPPDESKAGHLRRRLNELLFADLRFSYGQ